MYEYAQSISELAQILKKLFQVEIQSVAKSPLPKALQSRLSFLALRSMTVWRLAILLL